MKSKKALLYLLSILFLSCGNNNETGTDNHVSEAVEKYNIKVDSSSIELLNQANDYFENHQIEESKKNLLILIKKYPESKEATAAKDLLNKTNLELEKIAKTEDSIIKVKEKENKIRAEKATKDLRKKVDDLEGITWYFDKTSPRYTNRNGFYIYIGDRGYNRPSLRLRIQYNGDKWLFIQKYMIYVDGVKYKTITPEYGDVKRDNGNRGVWEWIDVPVSIYNDEVINDFTILMIIAESDDVKVRLEGNKYKKTITITNTQKKAIHNVLKAYEALGGKIF